MEENLQQSPIKVGLKKVWPFINRALNGMFYFLITIIKSVVKGALDQFKGKM